MRGKMEGGELRVFTLDLNLHRSAGGPARRAADLCDLIFEAVRQANLSSELGSAHGIADWFAGRFDVTGDAKLTTPPVDVDFELDRRESRLVHGFHRRGEDREHGRERIGVL